MFKKATKEQSRLRLALSAASGGGKTYSGLNIARELGKNVCLIDTERGSASKYSDEFNFDVCEINGDYHPDRLIKLLAEADNQGYDVVIIDSMTHFWNGTGGFLDLCDQEVKRMTSRGGKPDSFAAWKAVTPVYNRMIQAIMSSKAHVIVTMRAKQEYSKEGGKVQKLGVAPEMRDGFQYEMDIEGLLNERHELIVGKTRCPSIDSKIFEKPGKEFAELLKAWLNTGVAPREVASVPVSDVTTTEVSEAVELTTAMKAATTIEELKTAVDAAKLATSEKRITQDEYTELGKVYLAVKKGLAAA